MKLPVAEGGRISVIVVSTFASTRSIPAMLLNVPTKRRSVPLTVLRSVARRFPPTLRLASTVTLNSLASRHGSGGAYSQVTSKSLLPRDFTRTFLTNGESQIPKAGEAAVAAVLASATAVSLLNIPFSAIAAVITNKNVATIHLRVI